MTVPHWTLDWTWAGERGTVEHVAVAWTERVALFDAMPAVRSADLDLTLPIDVAALTEVHRPETGTAVLRIGTRIMLAGSWRNLKFQAPVQGHTRVSLTISETEADDLGTWPPVTSWRPSVGATTYRRYNTQSGELVPAEVADLVYAKAQEMRDAGKGRGALDVVTVNVDNAVGYEDFSSLAELSDGKGWPYPFGVGGSDDPIRPMCPAWVVDTSVNAEILLIAGCRVSAATVTVIGPDKSHVDRMMSVAGVAVHHAITTSGREYAYIEMQDVALVLEVSLDGFGKRWYTAWPIEGTPGGAGSLLALLYGLSGLRVDESAFAAFSEIGDRWRFAGYTDTATRPSAWGRNQILSLLPVAVVPGPSGWRPVLWPWIDGPTDTDARDLVDGVGIATTDDPVEYVSIDPVSRVVLRYAVRADTNGETATEYAGPRTTPYARAGAAGGDDDLTSDVLWDKTTAGALAHARLRARVWAPRQVAIYVLDRRYDAGGADELFAGDVVRFTSARFGWSRKPAVIAEIERDPYGNCRYVLYLRDDPLRVNG